jgi:hypothetical protein
MKTITGNPIFAGNLATPPIHVPDLNGGSYKTELTLIRTPERTEKIIWWHAGDPRDIPHNHPWPFVSTILSGGYTEDRFKIEADGSVSNETKTYRTGDLNDCPADVYHVVYDVLKGTVTHLVCGQQSPGAVWGYLDVNAVETYSPPPDPNFLTNFRAINPHMRPTA